LSRRSSELPSGRDAKDLRSAPGVCRFLRDLGLVQDNNKTNGGCRWPTVSRPQRYLARRRRVGKIKKKQRAWFVCALQAVLVRPPWRRCRYGLPVGGRIVPMLTQAVTGRYKQPAQGFWARQPSPPVALFSFVVIEVRRSRAVRRERPRVGRHTPRQTGCYTLSPIGLGHGDRHDSTVQARPAFATAVSVVALAPFWYRRGRLARVGQSATSEVRFTCSVVSRSSESIVDRCPWGLAFPALNEADGAIVCRRRGGERRHENASTLATRAPVCAFPDQTAD